MKSAPSRACQSGGQAAAPGTLSRMSRVCTRSVITVGSTGCSDEADDAPGGSCVAMAAPSAVPSTRRRRSEYSHVVSGDARHAAQQDLERLPALALSRPQEALAVARALLAGRPTAREAAVAHQA